MKKSHRNIIVKLNRDYSIVLSQFCNEKNYSGLLFVNIESYDNLLCKNTNFVIAPIFKQLNYQDKIIVAPSVIENNTTLTLEYGSLFVVHHILENQYGEIEGLEPGYSIITLNFLYQLNEEIVVGKKEPFWFELPPAKNLH
ncbi:hypothetical protein [Nitrosomonas communis]|uniref:Uncharacterized protein n=1 Tax=Nitrosomonas communis TaxID=44574 RepID=A0A1I4R2Y9_9PROT|nr:hypothetical protein [Nitrosomonas communis]SFM46668.1 hypothetical protein SAMN05421863_10305 [Nitrosomonas communis]